MRRYIGFAYPLLSLPLMAALANAQTDNLLQNPNADDGTKHWALKGDATVEQTGGGNLLFVVRNRGSFVQEVKLLEDAAGKYALFIGRTSSERINSDSAITGLPYLYGQLMARSGRLLSYPQGQQMLCSAKQENEWVTAWGIFQVPTAARAIRFFLNQAERKDVPQNGSAARFDDVGLYLFASENEAREFVKTYTEQRQ